MTLGRRLRSILLWGATCAIAALAGACVQASLNPLTLPEDSSFNDALLGVWTCGTETWTFTRETDIDTATKPLYSVAVKTPDTTGELNAWLGRVGDNQFITFVVKSDPNMPVFVRHHLLDVFTFGRITIDPAKVKLQMLDAGWIDQAERAGLLSIGVRRWPDDVILTAQPQDLQRFARAYGDDDRVFGQTMALVRGSASSSADPLCSSDAQ